MDFFAAQDLARTRTRKLVFLYGLAVLALMVMTHCAAAMILFWTTSEHSRHLTFSYYLFRSDLFIAFAIFVGLIVTAGTLVKIFALRQGGSAVAQEIGGQELSRQTTDPLESRLLNVVEEMAIASGTPVPRVFLLNQEEGINAFAAGYTLDDAAIGVTRGSIEKLNREQLQGVIAHEFSHILNSDMRLNIRLIGILNGIIWIFILGKTVLRIMAEVQPRRRSNRSSDKSDGSLTSVFLAVGLALIIIGSVGAFFARMIQSAVSRQREFLADSSAVQFTRNPEGLAGALSSIASNSGGSLVNHPKANEVEHLFFSNGVDGVIASLFSTHPPLRERIKRLTGKLPDIKDIERLAGAATASSGQISSLSGQPHSTEPSSTASLVSSIGQLSASHLESAQNWVRSLPPQLSEAVRDLQGAQCVAACLMLSPQGDSREKQIALITSPASPLPSTDILRLAGFIDSMPRDKHLSLLDLALATLRKLTPRQYTPLHTFLRALADADQELTLSEYLVLSILKHGVEPMVFSTPQPRSYITERSGLAGSLALILSTLAYNGAPDQESARTQFARTEATLASWPQLAMVPLAGLTFDGIDEALNELAKASPEIKRETVDACAALIKSDEMVTAAEIGLFRAIGAALGCPVPILDA